MVNEKKLTEEMDMGGGMLTEDMDMGVGEWLGEGSGRDLLWGGEWSRSRRMEKVDRREVVTACSHVHMFTACEFDTCHVIHETYNVIPSMSANKTFLVI